MIHRGIAASYRWWALAIVLLIVLVGHDVLMAAPSLDAPARSHIGHLAADIAESPGGASHPWHPTACGVAQDAAPLLSSMPGAPDGATSIAVCSVPTACFAADAKRDWFEPVWPPGVRRALLQVYRI